MVGAEHRGFRDRETFLAEFPRHLLERERASMLFVDVHEHLLVSLA